MTVHHFYLVYNDTRDGRNKAIDAVNSWLCQYLIQPPVWDAFYDRIELGEPKQDGVILEAKVDGIGELVEV